MRMFYKSEILLTYCGGGSMGVGKLVDKTSPKNQEKVTINYNNNNNISLENNFFFRKIRIVSLRSLWVKIEQRVIFSKI